MRTLFQQRVLEYLGGIRTSSASTWEVGQHAFPERWANPKSRGLLIAQVRSAGLTLEAAGDIAAVLPPKGSRGAAVLCRN